MRISAYHIAFEYDEKTSEGLFLRDGIELFRQRAATGGLHVERAWAEDNTICLHICRNDGVQILCRYCICFDEYPYIQLQISGSSNFSDPFFYPPALCLQQEDQLLYPYNEGVILSAKKPQAPIPQVMSFHSCETSSMSFYAVLRQNTFLMCAAVTNLDAGIQNEVGADGLLSTRLFWESVKGNWGYTRECRFYFAQGGITQVCKCYRTIMKQKGLLQTLTQKAEQLPQLRNLVGAANVWLWNDNMMQKLYDCEASDEPPTAQQLSYRIEIAKQMHEHGMHRILWSIFDHNISHDTIERIKSFGYFTTFYDIYTDVLPKPLLERISEFRVNRCRARIPYWPDGIQQNQDGSMQKAWPLKGKDGTFYDQNYLCDAVALECAKHHIPAHSLKNGLDGRFIDVIYGNMNECFHPAHPTTRSQSLAYKNQLMQLLLDLQLFVGTEVGREDGVPFFHYNEGMLSPILYRSSDAGRRMTHIYYGKQVDACITDYMLNSGCRVPLWELVFHDCVSSYWYWGDSTNCCPEYTRIRDLYCQLYGLPPIYSFDVSSWPQLQPLITQSYQRTVPLAISLGFCEMTDFQYLQHNRLVQKTAFSDGTEVVVNFGSEPYMYGNIRIESKDSYICR